MNNFFLIMGNYFKRFFRDYKENMLLLIIPIGLTIVYSFFESPEFIPGYNTQATFTMPIMVLGFQFFNGGIMLHYLYKDLRGDMRWRLRSTPQSLMSFVLTAFLAGIFSKLAIFNSSWHYHHRNFRFIPKCICWQFSDSSFSFAAGFTDSLICIYANILPCKEAEYSKCPHLYCFFWSFHSERYAFCPSWKRCFCEIYDVIWDADFTRQPRNYVLRSVS